MQVAGEAFKDALRDKVATSLDAARQDIVVEYSQVQARSS